MIKIKQSDADKIMIKIEDISCHIGPEEINNNEDISITAMIEELEKLKEFLIKLKNDFKNEGENSV